MDLERLKEEYIVQKDAQPPQGYLEGLEGRVLNKQEGLKGSATVLGLSRWAWAGAAAIGLVLLGLFQFIQPETLSTDEILTQLPEDQVVEYYLATTDEDLWMDDEWMDDVTLEEYYEILDQQEVDDEVFENLY